MQVQAALRGLRSCPASREGEAPARGPTGTVTEAAVCGDGACRAGVWLLSQRRQAAQRHDQSPEASGGAAEGWAVLFAWPAGQPDALMRGQRSIGLLVGRAVDYCLTAVSIQLRWPSRALCHVSPPAPRARSSRHLALQLPQRRISPCPQPPLSLHHGQQCSFVLRSPVALVYPEHAPGNMRTYFFVSLFFPSSQLRLIDWGLAEFYFPEREFNVRVASRYFKVGKKERKTVGKI
jgi:hypothetical protein